MYSVAMDDILIKNFGKLPHPDISPSLLAEFVKAAKKGMSFQDIRRAAGLSQDIIRKWYVGYRKSPRLEEFERMKEGVRKYKAKPKADCIIERMFKECGVNVNFVDM